MECKDVVDLYVQVVVIGRRGWQGLLAEREDQTQCLPMSFYRVVVYWQFGCEFEMNLASLRFGFWFAVLALSLQPVFHSRLYCISNLPAFHSTPSCALMLQCCLLCIHLAFGLAFPFMSFGAYFFGTVFTLHHFG